MLCIYIYLYVVYIRNMSNLPKNTNTLCNVLAKKSDPSKAMFWGLQGGFSVESENRVQAVLSLNNFVSSPMVV